MRIAYLDVGSTRERQEMWYTLMMTEESLSNCKNRLTLLRKSHSEYAASPTSHAGFLWLNGEE